LHNVQAYTYVLLVPVNTLLRSKFIWAHVLSENLSRLSKNHFATKYYLEKDIIPAIERDLAALTDYAEIEVADEEKIRLKSWVDDYRTVSELIINRFSKVLSRMSIYLC
jgi:hypothetical protein